MLGLGLGFWFGFGLGLGLELGLGLGLEHEAGEEVQQEQQSRGWLREDTTPGGPRASEQ